MGPSGSGKSTLLTLAGGLDTATSGEVLVEGVPLSGLDRAGLAQLRRRSVGYVFQELNLLPALTAAENVALPLLLAGSGRRAARKAAMLWLERLGVGDVADARPGAMSGGQQQRCAAARALVTEPRVLFADEPTGALDVLTGEHVLREIVQTARAREMAVVLVTHENHIAAYADREVVLRDGLVDASGLGVTA